tara:strand:+ start:381 stop:1136 length:756 start_codon:yes stop_codon:yes gene_type:complete
MENYLFKKSYRLNNFSKISYKSLWGAKGIFTTVRIYGNFNNLILIEDHIKRFNHSAKKTNINFRLSKKIIFELTKAYITLNSYDHLLRIACNKKILSISLRKRKKISKNFSVELVAYQRALPKIKNLKYKKILKLQKNINLKNQEIIFYNKHSLLEGSTSNIIAVKNDFLYIPKDNYYFGTTLNYLMKQSQMKVLKQNIRLRDLQQFSEILLVGSGKGVVSVDLIKNINWKRSSIKIYKRLMSLYKNLLVQ